MLYCEFSVELGSLKQWVERKSYLSSDFSSNGINVKS